MEPSKSRKPTAAAIALPGRRFAHFHPRLPDRSPPGLDRVAVAIAVQVVGEVPGGDIPLPGVFLQAFQADRLQVARHAWDQPRRGHRVVVDDLAERLHRRLSLERRAPGQDLIEDRAQGIGIRGRSDVLGVPAGLLGGHVAGRAHDLTGLGLPAVRFQPLGQAEVGDLGDPLVGEQDIGRLEISVNDPALMGRMDGPGQRGHQLGSGPSGLGRARQPVVEVPAFEQFQRHERQAVDFADVVDLQDVRVPEPGDRLGLDSEPGQMVHLRLLSAHDHLESHQAIQALLARLVHNAHAPFTELAEDVVAGNRRPAAPVRLRTDLGCQGRQTALQQRPLGLENRSIGGQLGRVEVDPPGGEPLGWSLGQVLRDGSTIEAVPIGRRGFAPGWDLADRGKIDGEVRLGIPRQAAPGGGPRLRRHEPRGAQLNAARQAVEPIMTPRRIRYGRPPPLRRPRRALHSEGAGGPGRWDTST